MAIFGDSVLLLTLNFHSQVSGVEIRQLMTIRGLHAGLPFQRQITLAKNCLNVGVKGMLQEMQVFESKLTMHKPVLLYQRLDDQTCITACVAYNYNGVMCGYTLVSYTKVMVVFIFNY